MGDHLYIYTHLGMGDHILCNAIIRKHARERKTVFHFVKPANAKNVYWMYRDLGNVRLIHFDDAEVRNFMSLNPRNEYLIIGHSPEYFSKFRNGVYSTFDAGFYEIAGIPFEEKWGGFYVERDLEREKDVYYESLGLKDGEEFYFVHDDPPRGRNFRESVLPKGKRIRPIEHTDIGLFDFLYTIERAKEAHVMNSSFSCLIDTIQLQGPKLFLHEYARKDMGSNPNHAMRLNWGIIK